MTEFRAFQKIPRYFRDIVVTEKIDGTNAVVCVSEEGGDGFIRAGDLWLRFGSRNRWISPEDDNFGFAAWGVEHAEELAQLGPGFHYGEWWGKGIQRGYGLDERRFSLFNVKRWGESRPSCCHVVPVVYAGRHESLTVLSLLEWLKENGSLAAPGFDDPEGLIVYHTASGNLYKVTLDGDQHKELTANTAV